MNFNDILITAATQGGGKSPVAVTFLSSGTNSVGSLGTLTLGAGFIVIAVDQLFITAGASTVASITINGVSAARLAGATGTGAGTDETVELWGAACTVSSGNVTVNWNGSPLRGGYGLWLVTGSTGVAFSSASAIINSPSVALNVPANGAIIAASANSVGTTSTTWTGLSTKDYDQQPGATNTYDSGAHQTFAAAVTPQTVSNNATGSSGISMVAVAFTP